MFNINQFKSRLITPPLRSNKYEVKLASFPKALSQDLREIYKDIRFYCEAVDLPDVGLMTADVKRYGYGPIEKKPYAPIFNECRLIIRGDQDGAIFTFFKQWQAASVNYQFYSSIEEDEPDAVDPYEIRYKGDYVAQVNIDVFADDGKVAHKVILRDAYPVMIGGTPLAWNMSDAYAQMPVMLAYSKIYVPANITRQESSRLRD